MKKFIVLMVAGLVIMLGSFMPAFGTPDNTDTDKTNKKVYVCKYVGTPGSDERLQTGQNPIEVSVNSIQNNEWDGTVPGWFSDAHDRSYVLGYVPMSPEPNKSSCPPPEQDNNNWTYEVACDGVRGTKPVGGSVDSNIKIKNLITNVTQTFNYHGPDNGPAGPFHYTLANYGVPSSWTYFAIQWVQVNGTNYHWEGYLKCGNKPTEHPTPTATATATVTPTDTVTVTAPPVTETVTVFPTTTVTETVTAPPVTQTATVTETPTVTETETVTAPPVTETVNVTETPTVTATATATETATTTVTETATVDVTETATVTATATTTETATATETETAKATATATVTETPGKTETESPGTPVIPNAGADEGADEPNMVGFVLGAGMFMLGAGLLAKKRKRA